MLRANRACRLAATLLEIALGVFLLSLVVLHFQADTGVSAHSTGGASPGASSLSAAQGTPIVATITDSIAGSDAVFAGQRHFRSGIRPDRNCRPDGVSGDRFFDQIFFMNTSSTTQSVSVQFTSGCAGNTYMAAYTPAFNSTNLCAGLISTPGVSGSVIWDFSVCAGTQFSIIVYGLEPGLTCSSYSYTMFANGVSLIGPTPSPALELAGVHPVSDEINQTLTDVPSKRERRLARAKALQFATSSQELPSEILLAAAGTPLVTVVTGSLSPGDPTFFGRLHSITGIRGDRNCSAVNATGFRLFDELLFVNTSASPQKVNVQFASGCGSFLYITAYSPQFDPLDICKNLVAQAGVPGSTNLDFEVCGNSQFSIVVYDRASTPHQCAFYTYNVFGEGITLKFADVSVAKSASTSGPVTLGQDITYALTVANNGPFPVAGVSLTDNLAPGTGFVSLNLLSSLGTLLPAPICTTPAPGAGGTVSCNIPLLGSAANGPNSLLFALVTRVTSTANGTLTNTAAANFGGMDTNPANNSAAAVVITGDFCIQADAGGLLLQINSRTGDYKFTHCTKGVLLTGRGVMSSASCKLSMQDLGPDPKRPDRKVLVNLNTCTGRANVSIELPGGQNFVFTDSNIGDNNCRCSP